MNVSLAELEDALALPRETPLQLEIWTIVADSLFTRIYGLSFGALTDEQVETLLSLPKELLPEDGIIGTVN